MDPPKYVECCKSACNRSQLFASLNTFGPLSFNQVAELNASEIVNEMSWHSHFRQLYHTKDEEEKEGLFRQVTTSTLDISTSSRSLTNPSSPPSSGLIDVGIVPAPRKKNMERNLMRRKFHSVMWWDSLR